jgi:hypothetical protein
MFFFRKTDRQAFDPSDPFGTLQQLAQDRAARRERLVPVIAFWSEALARLADTHAAALRDANLQPTTARQTVKQLNESISAGYAALFAQSDLRWGENCTDSALHELGHNAFGLRVKASTGS